MAVARRKTGKYHSSREIMEEYHHDFLNRANSITKELIEIQNKMVEMLPTCKENLPKSFEELEGQEAQRNLSDYIRLRLLFELAGELWKSIENQCYNLAKMHKDNDVYGEKDAEAALCQLLNDTSSFPFEKVENGIIDVLGFYELFKQGIFEQWMVVTAFGQWRFGDIVGVIKMHGLQDEGLWRDAVNDAIPTRSNIGELLPGQ